MAKVEKLVPFILKWEGGFSNDPDDAGGATMKGITFATFKEYRKAKGLPAPTVNDLKNISNAEWTDILKIRYWNPWKADDIAFQPIANLLVGWAWGSGVITSIKAFQTEFKLTADGVIGSKTISFINSYPNQVELFNKIVTARKNFFVNIVKNKPTQIKFFSGWLNRLYDNVTYNFNLVIK